MCGGPLSAPNIKPWLAAQSVCVCVCVCAAMMGVGGLAEEFRLQVEPLQDVLGHAQDRINRLDLLISEKGETCDSKQSVERIHLQRWRRRVNENQRDTPIRTG